MTIKNKELSAISVEKTTIDNITDESLFHMDDMQSVDGGDHQVNIWKDDAGKMKISIQGTGEGVTLLTADTAEMLDMGASQWAGDDHTAMSVQPH